MPASVMPQPVAQPTPTSTASNTLHARATQVEQQRPRDATVWQLISQPRTNRAKARGALWLSLGSALLLWASFTPLDFGPLAWVALVPLMQLVRLQRPTRAMYRMVYLGGLAFWLTSLQWLRLGHPAMYGALIAASVYFAIYFPLFVGLSRVGYWKLKLPLPIVAPVVLVGLELLRGHIMTGFSWYYLGHTQYRWVELIQVSDLVGGYGVSFVIAVVAAGAAELVPANWLKWAQLSPPLEEKMPLFSPVSRPALRAVLCLAVLASALGYGYYRRGQAEFKAGPRVSLIQGNFTSSVKHNPNDFPLIQQKHEILTGHAVLDRPDLIIWPETMFRWPLFETASGMTDAEVQKAHPDLPVATLRNLQVTSRLVALSQMAKAGLIIGLESITADAAKVRTYNSAAFIDPERARVVGRYDKMHRVIFGEYIPLVETFPFLKHFTPYPEGFGLSAGRGVSVFEYKGYRFSPVICFEDTVPHLVRGMVAATTEQTPNGPRKIDFIVNLTNDGWFHGSSELDQHLISAAFRSVECRTPMVRAVNTGISAFIDGDGVIRKRARDPETGRSKQVEAVVTDYVALDNRSSPYVRYGDWFGGSCAGICAFLGMIGLFARWRPAPQPVG